MADGPDFEIEWRDAGSEPRCATNPAYPDGVDLDVSRGRPGCIASLPYPTRRCGAYVVTCRRCGYRAACTTAGRPDDPRSIKVPCKERSAVPLIQQRETEH